MRLVFFHSADFFNFLFKLLFLYSLPFCYLKVPLIYESVMFCFWLSKKFVSFLLCIWILSLQFFQQLLLPNQFLFWVKKLFRQIWNFHFVFRFFILEFMANELTFITDRENVIVVKTDHHLIDPLGVGLNFINFLVQTQWISTISDCSRLILFIRGVHKNFFAVQEHDFRNVGVGEDSAWSWNSVFDSILFYALSLLVLFCLWGDLDLVNALVFVADWCVECTTDVNCSLIDQAQFLILSDKNTCDWLNVQTRSSQYLKFNRGIFKLVVINKPIVCAQKYSQIIILPS